MSQYNYKSNILKIFGHEPATLDELGECVVKVINSRVKVLGFKWYVTQGKVSNSHSCPINGQTNWGGLRAKDGVPRNYPGWEGRVWIRYDNGCDAGSDPFSLTRTHPGTGGSGGYNGPFSEIETAYWRRYGYRKLDKQNRKPRIFSWDYRFFDSDWPLIEMSLGEEKTFNKLAGRQDLHLNHTFEMYDEETAKQDREFIAECLDHPELNVIKGR